MFGIGRTIPDSQRRTRPRRTINFKSEVFNAVFVIKKIGDVSFNGVTYGRAESPPISSFEATSQNNKRDRTEASSR